MHCNIKFNDFQMMSTKMRIKFSLKNKHIHKYGRDQWMEKILSTHDMFSKDTILIISHFKMKLTLNLNLNLNLILFLYFK